MNTTRNSVFLHLNTSLWTLAPIALMVLTPTFWWGWALKIVAGLWIVGAVIALFRIDASGDKIFGTRTGGYLLAMPFFALALWLDPGWLRTASSFAFAFFNVTSFMILRRGVETALASAKSSSE